MEKQLKKLYSQYQSGGIDIWTFLKRLELSKYPEVNKISIKAKKSIKGAKIRRKETKK